MLLLDEPQQRTVYRYWEKQVKRFRKPASYWKALGLESSPEYIRAVAIHGIPNVAKLKVMSNQSMAVTPSLTESLGGSDPLFALAYWNSAGNLTPELVG